MRNSKYACKRKTRYSKKEAEEQLILKLVTKGVGGSKYSCEHCGWWHITKEPRRT